MNHPWHQFMLQLSELNVPDGSLEDTQNLKAQATPDHASVAQTAQASPLQVESSYPETACEPLTNHLLKDTALFLSHELRTPLTSIQGVLGLLDTGLLGPLSEEGHQLLSIAIKNVDRLTRLAHLIEHDTFCTASVLSTADLEELQLENSLKQALDRGDLNLVYQPIVTVIPTVAGKNAYHINGFETLIRWHHPDKGYISPAVFIPIAERSDTIDVIGLWVLEQACQQLSIWQAQIASPTPLYISVNLSAQQLLKPDLPEKIQQILTKVGLTPAALRLEITETALFEHQQSAISTLLRLQEMGLKLYLDDFGTGYSSLSRLQDLPFDVLKIDLSFVRSKRWDICSTIVNLASNLGLDVVAEGVELQEDLEALQRLGCRQMQGYLFSKPVESETVTLLLASSCTAYT